MFCKNCGSEIPEGAKFCPKCGQETATAPEDVSLEQENFEQEEEYVYGDAEAKPSRRASRNTSLILGIIGIIFFVNGIPFFYEVSLCIWAMIFGVLALVFGYRFIAHNKRFPRKSKYVGLILGIIDILGPIILLIIAGIAYYSYYRGY